MIASPAAASYAETRVWGFELEEPTHTRAQPTLSETCIEGYPPAYGGLVVGCSPVPRGRGDARTSPWLADSRPAVVEHLERFREGGSFLLPKPFYERFFEGKSLAGRPDGQFITTRSAMDQLLYETGGDVTAINKRLGTNWNGPLVRVDVNDPLLYDARLPSGLEAGADPEFFRWGGYTSGGSPEIIVDPLPAGGFVGTPVSSP